MALLIISTAAPALGGNPVYIEKVPLEYGYIKTDGTIEPSTLPIERQGNLYTLKADLTNTSLTIMKNDAIFDGNGFTLALSPDIWDYGNSADSRIIIQHANSVIVQNTRFKNHGLAIDIDASSRVTILGNNFEAGSTGVWVDSESPNCDIVGNNFNNVHTAIHGYGSVKCLNVAYNNISKGTFACTFSGELTYSNVTRNNVEYTWYGIYLSGLYAWEGHDNTFSENNFIGNRVGGLIVAVLWPDENNTFADKVYRNYFKDNGFGNSEISDKILYKDSDINQLPQSTPLFNNIQIQLYREPTSQPFNLDEYLYKTTPPNEAPFPNVLIVPLATACAGGAFAAGAALLFYFKKHKHKRS